VKIVLFCSLVLVTDYFVGSFLKKGLAIHHGFGNHAQVLCVGHSRSDHGIDRKRLEKALNVPVAKYALAGMDVHDRLAMLRHYLAEHPQQVKMVVYDIDFFTFNGRTGEDVQSGKQYRQLYPFIDNDVIDSYVKGKSSWPEYWARKYIRSLRFNDPKVFARAVINHFKTPEIPRTKFDFEKYGEEIKRSQNPYGQLTINNDAVAGFEETMSFLRAQNVKVTLLFLPVSDLERDLISLNYRKKVMSMAREYTANNPGMVFAEGNARYEQSHELFYDSLHFNKQGQELASDDLAKVLKQAM
jgi:hypothetical protein